MALLVVGLLLVAVFLAAGCGKLQTDLNREPSRKQLHAALRTLVPPGAQVLRVVDGSCDTSPCINATAYFRSKHRRAEDRIDEFIDNARIHGWKAERLSHPATSVGVHVDRGHIWGYSGAGQIWRDRYYRPNGPCRPYGNPTYGYRCVDSVFIQSKVLFPD